MQENKRGQAETESSGRQSTCWASWEHRLLQKRKRPWSRRLRNSCHFPGAAPPQPPPALASLRGSYVLHPQPHPRPSSFLSPPPSFLHHRVTPGPDTPCSGSGLEPVRNQSAPFTQVWILPEGGLKDQRAGPQRRGFAS